MRRKCKNCKSIVAISLLSTGLLLPYVSASAVRPAPRQETTPPPTTSAAPTVTAVSECHLHESSVYCMDGTVEFLVKTSVTATSDIPPSFTGCHQHGSETFCLTPEGDDVQLLPAKEEDAHENDGAGGHNDEKDNHVHCHFHAGVEHCVGGSEGESGPASCSRIEREYNIPLRVGLLFAILVTSAIGVFGPIFMLNMLPKRLEVLFSTLKQFGTGVVISTAFVHLLTHAHLMFENRCLGELAYEGTAAAILMAGIFLSFLIEYGGHRLAAWHVAKKTGGLAESPLSQSASNEMINILVLESGIIFHSLLIGLTLVVAADSFFLTLFAVILFHQMFEGVALGTRIAALGTAHAMSLQRGHCHSHTHASLGNSISLDAAGTESSSTTVSAKTSAVSLSKKLMLATAFALVTPIGMAIGIGVLHRFNGNDPSTIIAIGTLDAFSAGILVWVGVVEMWAQDWMLGGEMAEAGPLKTSLGMGGLVTGMVLMSILGKWA